MTPGLRHGGFSFARGVARAALLLPLILSGCSSVFVPREDMPKAGPDPAFNQLVVDHLKSFKDYQSYDEFEISDFRWVHTVSGWNWLTCVRFRDSGRRRNYAIYIRDRAVDGRYAVETDECGTQNYRPFERMGAKMRGALDPLY